MTSRMLINLLIVAISYSHTSAQKPGFFRGGLSLFGASAGKNGASTVVPAFTGWPGYRFYQKKDFSLSVGSPLSLGLTYIDDDAYLGADIPATLDLNFGCSASDFSKSKFGFMMGAGLSYFYSYNEVVQDAETIDRSCVGFFGQLVHCGFIFRLKNKENLNDAPSSLMIRFSYMTKYLNSSKKAAGIGLILTFPKNPGAN